MNREEIGRVNHSFVSVVHSGLRNVLVYGLNKLKCK